MDFSLRRILLRGTTHHKHHTISTSARWRTSLLSQFSASAHVLARHYSSASLNVIRANYLFAAFPSIPQRPKSPRISYLYDYQKSSQTFLINSLYPSPTRSNRSNHTMATTVPITENATPPGQEIKPLTGVEASKRLAAYRAVEDHFDPSYSYIGIGSGSTVVYVVEAIAAKGRDVTSRMTFVPTGEQSKQLIIEAGLPLGSIDALPPVEVEETEMGRVSALHVATGLQDLGLRGKRQSIDVAFDGADEIDEELNCIKGGGACLFQEKLVATAAKKFICVAGQLFPP